MGHDIVIGLASMVNLDRAVIDGTQPVFAKLIVDRNTRRVLGHVVGEQAVEIVHLVAANMVAEALSKPGLAGTILPDIYR